MSKSYKKQDQHLYYDDKDSQGMTQDDKIPSNFQEAILSVVNHPDYKPMRLKELSILLEIPRNMRNEFEHYINDMINSGRLTISMKGKIARCGIFTQTGIYHTTKRNFGFITPDHEEGTEVEDLFVRDEDCLAAFDNDRVRFRIAIDSNQSRRQRSSNNHQRAVITKILEHNTTQLVGTISCSKKFAFLIPDNPKVVTDIFIENEYLHGAKSGDKAVVRITSFPESVRKCPTGMVEEILGNDKDPGTDILAIAVANGLPREFPEEVMQYCESIPDHVSKEAYKDRKDLRDLLTITIDGEDAKDFDDAISLERLANGNVMLGVHIADVSHYVTEGSVLDKEALKRGTSNYLVDRVIPMLPFALSNGICSLNEGVDRLTLSVLMEVDDKGNVIGHEICETVICSNHRMTYTKVNEMILDPDSKLYEEYPDLKEFIPDVYSLSLLLRDKRGRRGAINFDFPESKITLDENGKPIKIAAYDTNHATRLIEDFMLLANETVAEDYYWQSMPFLYRVHPEPDSEKMKAFALFINHFGYSIRLSNSEDGIRVHPGALASLMEKIEGSPAENLISRIALRSMKKAKYDTECIGHFGLSAKYYTHFTSPIRRYPDLQIHRIIKECIHGKMNEERMMHYESILPEVASQTSKSEVLAEETERLVIKRKKAQYMQDHIGEIYEGVISGVTKWGFYVELDNTVEGMVRLSDMTDDYYCADLDHYCVIGTMTRKTYTLGEKVKILVEDVDLWDNTIDFSLVK